MQRIRTVLFGIEKIMLGSVGNVSVDFVYRMHLTVENVTRKQKTDTVCVCTVSVRIMPFSL